MRKRVTTENRDKNVFARSLYIIIINCHHCEDRSNKFVIFIDEIRVCESKHNSRVDCWTIINKLRKRQLPGFG